MSETAPEPQAQPAPEPAADAWTPPSKEEFEQLVGAVWEQHGRITAMDQYIQAMNEQGGPQAAPQAPAAPEMDDEWYGDKEAVQELVQKGIEEKLGQMLNQHPVVQQMAEQRGAEMVRGIYDQVAAEKGKFDYAMAYHVAQSFKQANPNVTPEQALQMGAMQAIQYRETERQAAIEEYKAQLANLANAPTEPSGQGTAAQPAKPVSRDYDEVANQFLARRNAQLSPN